MAEALLASFDPRLKVHSAGTKPASAVHPSAVRVMREAGIDLSANRPKKVDEFLAQAFDYVITVCDGANETCPYFTGKVGKRMHIGFPDPADATGTEEEILNVFRNSRDAIRAKFHELYEREMKAMLD
jgi:arsenate reductase